MNDVAIQRLNRFTHKDTFSHSKTFGSALALPNTLGRVAKYIKDQGATSYCTAAARTVAGSYLWGEEMSFEFGTAKEGQVIGSPIYDGADPVLADKAYEEYGFLLDKDCPLKFDGNGWEIPAQWQLYPTTLDQEAHAYTEFAPFNVFPDYSSIKQALFQGRDDGAVVIANGWWFDNWQSGISIVPIPNVSVTRHSYIFIDWKTIDGVEYLVAQLSQGQFFGDGGLFYMTKEVVNTAFKSPAYYGLGCTIYRKGATNPIQTEIHWYQQLIMLLGKYIDILLMRNV